MSTGSGGEDRSAEDNESEAAGIRKSHTRLRAHRADQETPRIPLRRAEAAERLQKRPPSARRFDHFSTQPAAGGTEKRVMKSSRPARRGRDRRHSQPECKVDVSSALVITERDEIRQGLEADLSVARHLCVKAPGAVVEFLGRHLPLTGVLIDAELDWEVAERLLGEIRCRWSVIPVVAVGVPRSGVRAFAGEVDIDCCVVTDTRGAMVEGAASHARGFQQAFEELDEAIVAFAEAHGLTRRQTDSMRVHLNGVAFGYRHEYLGIGASTLRNTFGDACRRMNVPKRDFYAYFEQWRRSWLARRSSSG